jgi:1,4-alpha-glucan branching enzyme
MLTKIMKPSNGSCEVTFTMQPEFDACAAYLCGDFNDWVERGLPMQRRCDGSFTLTVPLPKGQSYRFRYHMADGRWENDWGADDYAPSERGYLDSVVNT